MSDLGKRLIKGKPLDHIFPAAIQPALKLVTYQKGQVIALAGQEVPYLFVILSGRAVVKQLGSDGQETVLGYVYPGDLIGEIEVFTGNIFLHYVYADSEVELLWVPVYQVKQELYHHVPFLHFVMEGAFGKLLTRTTYFSDTRLYGHKSRTMTYIQELVDKLGDQTVPFVIHEVAPFIGVSERQLRRIIKEFEADGLVTKNYKTLTLHSCMKRDS